MSKATTYKVGSILKNRVGQYCKVISFQKAIYGVSDWTTLGNAKKATVANKFVNTYGMKIAGVTVEQAGAGKAKAPAKSATKTTAKKTTKTTAKKTAKKAAPKRK